MIKRLFAAIAFAVGGFLATAPAASAAPISAGIAMPIEARADANVEKAQYYYGSRRYYRPRYYAPRRYYRAPRYYYRPYYRPRAYYRPYRYYY